MTPVPTCRDARRRGRSLRGARARSTTLTGGYGYDREIVAGLRARGWTVHGARAAPASFPFPYRRPIAPPRRARSPRCPTDALVVVDGLAFGALPDEAARDARPAALVALVHHPLAVETGLAADDAPRLRGERAAGAAGRDATSS